MRAHLRSGNRKMGRASVVQRFRNWSWSTGSILWRICREVEKVDNPSGSPLEYIESWSPTGKTRGALVNAPAGRHPGRTLAHSSTAKGRSLLLPG
jgi:hypothetical protein